MRTTFQEMIALLSELIACHSPAGEEQEVEAVIRREFEASGAHVWQDDASNLYAHLPGEGPRVMICAHKDEIGMVVTQVEEDGRLRVEGGGGAWPWKYGEGPVDLIADDGSCVRGILSVGSVHATSGPVHELKSSRALTWDLTTVFTGCSKEELTARGVHVGSRVAIARECKQVQRLGDFVACFALDDRMGLVALVAALREMISGGGPCPPLYFVATHGEEVGMAGALRAARLVRPDMCVALDTSPTGPEAPVVVDARPVIWYREAAAYHSKRECDLLLHLANQLGFGAQPCVYAGAASDAGRIRQEGLAGRTVCFGFARENSHGFEIAHAGSLVNVTRLLVEFLRQWERGN